MAFLRQNRLKIKIFVKIVFCTHKLVKIFIFEHFNVKNPIYINYFQWDGETALWRYDERAERCINPDSSILGDEDSCDENYEQIRQRSFLRRRLCKNTARMSTAGALRLSTKPAERRVVPSGPVPNRKLRPMIAR